MRKRNVNQNLNLLSLQINEFESYLLSRELYWPLSFRAPAGERPYRRLTTGNLLLNVNEISANLDVLSPTQQVDFYDLMASWDMLRRQWLSALQEKAAAELESRINLWEAYITDLREQKTDGIHFSVEVRNRVICELIPEQLGNLPVSTDHKTKLKKMDGYLGRLFKTGPFLWHEDLESMYPADPYWYLYGNPVVEENDKR